MCGISFLLATYDLYHQLTNGLHCYSGCKSDNVKDGALLSVYLRSSYHKSASLTYLLINILPVRSRVRLRNPSHSHGPFWHQHCLGAFDSPCLLACFTLLLLLTSALSTLCAEVLPHPWLQTALTQLWWLPSRLCPIPSQIFLTVSSFP